MTKALFKKQLMEVFAWVYKDRKTGKIRTAKSIAVYIVLYLFLFGFLGSVFYIVADALCKPLLTVQMGWFYWCLMGLISIFLGVFGSVFNTYLNTPKYATFKPTPSTNHILLLFLPINLPRK